MTKRNNAVDQSLQRHFALMLFLATLFLSGCGFHLRGLIDLPEWLNNVYIISNDGNQEIIATLKSQLESYKIHVNPDPSLATYWLIINKINFQQHIVSIGASTNPRQYQLILTLSFTLQTSKGKPIKSDQLISVSRQLTVNSDRILGSNDEETILIGEMRKEAALQIINRLGHR